MTAMSDNIASYSQEMLDHGMKSLTGLSKSAQAIVTEATGYTRSSYESAAAVIEKLMAARSIESVMQIQADYAKAAYEGFVAEGGKLSGLYTDMAKEAYKPFESLVAKAG